MYVDITLGLRRCVTATLQRTLIVLQQLTFVTTLTLATLLFHNPPHFMHQRQPACDNEPVMPLPGVSMCTEMYMCGVSEIYVYRYFR